MNYLSLAAIMRNEEAYLADWVKFHRKIGVERFYLFDNCSTDHTMDIALSLGEDVVTEHWPGQIAQKSAYEFAVQLCKDLTVWLGFIDIDELLVPHDHKNLHGFLKTFEGFAGLGVHWYLFGSNGHEHYEGWPMVERFTKRQSDVNPHIKCIVDPRKTTTYITPHKFNHTGDFVDERYQKLNDGYGVYDKGTCDKIQINHYATKSKDECFERRCRPRADTGQVRDPHQFFSEHDRNDVEDLTAYKIWMFE